MSSFFFLIENVAYYLHHMHPQYMFACVASESFFVLYLLYADKSCSHICICFIYCTTKHCWSTFNNERSQGNTDYYSFSNVEIKEHDCQVMVEYGTQNVSTLILWIYDGLMVCYGGNQRCYGCLSWKCSHLGLACNRIDLSVWIFTVLKVFHQFLLIVIYQYQCCELWQFIPRK